MADHQLVKTRSVSTFAFASGVPMGPGQKMPRGSLLTSHYSFAPYTNAWVVSTHTYGQHEDLTVFITMEQVKDISL